MDKTKERYERIKSQGLFVAAGDDKHPGPVIIRRKENSDESPEAKENKDGGPGSGNHGHAGRPGQLGGSAPGNGSRPVVHGKDLSKSYKGSKKTRDVVHAQGYDGLPKIVGKKEFDEAVKASSFIAQRTYAASSQEILDEYRNQLYNGEFYVDCEVGGAQYGQGMYCAADYTGELTEGITGEMDAYKQLQDERHGEKLSTEQQRDITLSAVREQFKDSPDLATMEKYVEAKYSGDWKQLVEAEDALSGKDVQTIDRISDKTPRNTDAPDYTETLTLDPSAKTITYKELSRMQTDEITGIKTEVRDRTGHDFVEKSGMTGEARNFLLWGLNISQDVEPFDLDRAMQYKKTLSPEENKKFYDMRTEIQTAIREEQKKSSAGELEDMDMGAYAAMKGYDAINAEGHGRSGSYTVILNRTKVIFLDESIQGDAKDDSSIHFQVGPDNVIYAIRDRKVIGTVETYTVMKKADDRSDSEEYGFLLPAQFRAAIGKIQARISDAADFSLDNGGRSGTIKSQETNTDGAPYGNKNAAGRHNVKKKATPEQAKKFRSTLTGMKTSDGKRVKAVHQHAIDQAVSRNIFPNTVKTALSKGKVRNGNKPNRIVYEYNGTSVVYDTSSDMVVTAIYKGKTGK